MQRSAPKKLLWLISVILGVLSLVAYFVAIPFVSTYVFWFMGAAWLLLVVGTSMKGV